MNKRTLKRIFNKKKKQLGIPEAKLIVRQMNKKLATASIKTNTVTFNKKILENITKNEAETIIIHELLHLKLKTINHTKQYFQIEAKLLARNKETRVDKLVKSILLTSRKKFFDKDNV